MVDGALRTIAELARATHAPALVAQSDPTKRGLKMTESNVELARRGYGAAVRGDFDAIGELLDPEVMWHGGDPSAPGSCHNRQEALQFMRNAWSRRGRGPGELVDVIDAGERVVVIVRPRSDEGEAATPAANLTTFRNGKVVEMVHYPNPADALAAAGISK